jgi:DNA-binding NarL/FixJ family response regulator
MDAESSGPTKPTRVMLVGSYRIAQWGIEQLVEKSDASMQVVARIATCAGALEAAAGCAPHLVVLDPDEAHEESGKVIAALVAGAARVLILTGLRDEALREGFMLHGASGVVQKDEPPETLLKAIAKVQQGELWLDRTTVGKLFVALSRPKPSAPDPHAQRLSSLTPRERQIVARLATDPAADNRKLAENLHLCENTLRNHLSRIYDKLGVPNRLQLYVYAERHLPLPPPQ